MDKSRIPELRRAMMRVVRKAAEPGGPIDREEFTISIARAEVTRRLGLENGALDGKWKQLVKEEVNRAPAAVNDGEDEAESSTSANSPPIPDMSLRQTKTEPTGNASESEMSSVYDAPRKARKRKSDTRDEGGKKDGKQDGKGKKRIKKDPNEALTADEARVADLKRIVVACGVRKQWSKEFEDCPTTKSQISALQRILKDLGMEGKPSIGKAKQIKEARELASELNDVKEFEAARGVSGEGRPKRGGKNKAATQEDSDEEAEHEQKEQGAADAVMAFLGADDSD